MKIKIIFSLILSYSPFLFLKNTYAFELPDVDPIECKTSLREDFLSNKGTISSVIDNIGKNFDPENSKQGKIVDSFSVTFATAALATYTAGVDGFNVTSILNLIKNILDNVYKFDFPNGNIAVPVCEKKNPAKEITLAKNIINTFYSTHKLGVNQFSSSSDIFTIPKNSKNILIIGKENKMNLVKFMNFKEDDITITSVSTLEFPLIALNKRKDSCKEGLTLKGGQYCTVEYSFDSSKVIKQNSQSIIVNYVSNTGPHSVSSNISYGTFDKDCVPFKVYAPWGIGYAIDIKGPNNPEINLASCAILNEENYGGNKEYPDYFKNISVGQTSPKIYVLKNSTVRIHRFWGSNNDYFYNIKNGINNFVQCNGTLFGNMNCWETRRDF
ncbi:hypothetical protein GCL60_14540 [Silvanigrella paludirubra]|uniref:Uncharacterized protein n=1 Tax=Silvanigrella paludirubra TaxID=2499159 RepID=A0A6N6VQU1_9BACT|nr:hypothetical protein [Silvanigrella paludirubra]KAB8037047.1 hypothetical protein GCL60_14540 [Silvanigrella paludirubra]